MKTTLTVFLVLISLTLCAQTMVKGTLVDSKTLKPICHVHVIVKELSQQITGCDTDSTGSFTLPIRQNSTLIFASFLNATHEIHNVFVDSGTIDLGQICLVDIGYSGYVMVSKKKFLSKKTKLKCIFVNNRKDLNPEDFVINCPNGEGTYTWNFDKTLSRLTLDFETIKNFKQHQ